MQERNPRHRSLLEQVRASLLMLGFGLSVLGFLIAIDRPEWFHLRPATGTAAAMAHAAAPAEQARTAISRIRG
ncbi:hypothetical protein KZ810_05105 [Sphingomonas sp. RHCKR47]|jgi:hypothetical protein|uniref:hypothetical protein n=1 Tax=Sphingomonas citricola TaxID=2862498 RepID=UPI001CA59FD2|nr:hypothetical protein [Sphingomonas citricola]MBW6522869.1 hypothetical protein [Sphingomonas citricola]